MNNCRKFLFIRSITIISFVCSTLLAFFLTLRQDKQWLLTAIIFLIFTIVLWFIIGFLYKKEKKIEFFLSIAIINFLLVVPEFSLRAMGFEYISKIQFGYPTPKDFLRFVPDEKLFWKMPSSISWVNSLGFPGKEVATPKPKNIYRTLHFGDSCTTQGYSKVVTRYLNKKYKKKTFEGVQLAVAGYSSYQGKVLAKMYGTKMQPDLAVVWYGWNDHWQAYGKTDAKKNLNISKLPAKWNKKILYIYQKIRVLQALRWLIAKISTPNANKPLSQVRVPEKDYQENLLQIKSLLKKTPVIFVTSPTSHYKLGVPDPLIDLNFGPSKKAILTRHRRYNQILREMAKKNNWHLLDLETKFNSWPEPRQIFDKDGIHFTYFGVELVGKEVFSYIKKNILVNQK